MTSPVGRGTGTPVDGLGRLGEKHFDGSEHTFELGNDFGFKIEHGLSSLPGYGKRNSITPV
jgi:hypothetical protein